MQKEDIDRIRGSSWGAREKEDDGGEKPDWLKTFETEREGSIISIRRKKKNVKNEGTPTTNGENE